ncbi:MAG: hypothetical protein KAW12_10005, partial [Candidatus Aminicenantes bacterium]|nr:hypothetical protein [Candidatus Aminicenantes bacterium]
NGGVTRQGRRRQSNFISGKPGITGGIRGSKIPCKLEETCRSMSLPTTSILKLRFLTTYRHVPLL